MKATDNLVIKQPSPGLPSLRKTLSKESEIPVSGSNKVNLPLTKTKDSKQAVGIKRIIEESKTAFSIGSRNRKGKF